MWQQFIVDIWKCLYVLFNKLMDVPASLIGDLISSGFNSSYINSPSPGKGECGVTAKQSWGLFPGDITCMLLVVVCLRGCGFLLGSDVHIWCKMLRLRACSLRTARHQYGALFFLFNFPSPVSIQTSNLRWFFSGGELIYLRLSAYASKLICNSALADTSSPFVMASSCINQSCKQDRQRHQALQTPSL